MRRIALALLVSFALLFAVLPAWAGSYLDRAKVRPGMLERGTGPVAAFAAIGWRWGGEWENPRDYMHFIANRR